MRRLVLCSLLVTTWALAEEAAPSAPQTQSPPVALSARIEPDPVPFGEPFSLVVELTRPRGLNLEVQGRGPDVPGAPRAGEVTQSFEELGDGRVRETLRFPFLALDTQELKTPAFALDVAAPGEPSSPLEVPGLAVRVEVPPAAGATESSTPRRAGSRSPSMPPSSCSRCPTSARGGRSARSSCWCSPSSGAGGSSGGAGRGLRGRRRPPPRPAHEVALQRLAALVDSGLLARGETGPFVSRLMDEVLRDYLAARFSLPAGARTTRELVSDLLGVTVPGLDVSLVHSLLADADLVKFAKASLPSDRAHAMAQRVRTLIEATAVPAQAEGGGT